MRLIPRTHSRFLATEHGFSMIIVMGVMAASSLFVAAAFSAANGDLPLTRDSQDRKQAYAAAEAGINLYQYHLNQDPDYWTKCTLVPAPNGSEQQPVNDKWTTGTTDPRRWRNVAGMPTQYTLELLPANGAPKCVPGDLSTMIDPDTGSFRIRATGRPRAGSKLRRSIIASFRRNSFLDFLYFTDFETTDPSNYDPDDQVDAQRDCGDKYRPARKSTCREIVFGDADSIKGPLHTNDNIITCGTPEFGRPGKADAIEFTQPAPGWTAQSSGCPSGPPVWNGPLNPGATTLTMPPTNTTLQTLATPPQTGKLYAGKTDIRFTGSTMTVYNNKQSPKTQVNVPFPANGVIYVKNDTNGCGTPPPPSNADYDRELESCGNVNVSGTYAKSLTIAAANDIIIRPTGTDLTNGDVLHSGDAVLGLIATNFVRAYHSVNGCTNEAPVMNDVTIDAAILTLKHSFTADNYDCGAKLGTITVNGAIAQKYRGAVGTTTPRGFTKNYVYDERFRYRSPPYFLDPIAATWHVIRSNEQVPAR